MLHMLSEGHGPAVVLLHGWGFDNRVFSSLCKKLTPSWRVYALDLPGFGQSPLLPWRDFCRAFFAQIPEPCMILGWSLGGLYAQRLALEYPDRVMGLYGVATSPYFLNDVQWPGIMPSVLARFKARVEKDSTGAFLDFLALQNLPTNSFQECSFQNRSDALASGLQTLCDWDLRVPMHSLSCPARFIFGRCDAIVPHSLAAKLQEDYPHLEINLYQHAAHMPFMSNLNQFHNDLEQFLYERIFYNRYRYR